LLSRLLVGVVMARPPLRLFASLQLQNRALRRGYQALVVVDGRVAMGGCLGCGSVLQTIVRVQSTGAQ
jgi:hypothetical protein